MRTIHQYDDNHQKKKERNAQISSVVPNRRQVTAHRINQYLVLIKLEDDVWEPPVPFTLRLSWLLIYLQVVRTLKMPFESRQVPARQAQATIRDLIA